VRLTSVIDRYAACGRLGRLGCPTIGRKHEIYLQLNQLTGEGGQAIGPLLCPPALTMMFCPSIQPSSRIACQKSVRGEAGSEPRECQRLLRVCGEWHHREADSESDREPDPPPGHLGGG
jgi:hypothetical protein